jgi:very-short-patch-repair endonuclease
MRKSRVDAGTELEFMLKIAKINGFEREYRFHPIRKWRFDFAFPAQGLAVEIEGGVWTGGRHTSGAGFTKDMEKYNTAALRGWRLLRFTPRQVKLGVALAYIKEALT